MLGKAEIVRGWNGKIQNVYRREVLYQEVWNHPITEVAKKYAVSDASIRCADPWRFQRRRWDIGQKRSGLV